MEDNKLTVKMEDNQEITIDVIDIIQNSENNKEYIIYNIENDEENVYMSILDEQDDSYTLKEITDENELRMLEEYLESLPENFEETEG